MVSVIPNHSGIRGLANQGYLVICALISPYAEDRLEARSIIGSDRFVLAYVCCPLAECERRDSKGLYARARAGELENFTGINDPYEEPSGSEHITLHTDRETVLECVRKLNV